MSTLPTGRRASEDFLGHGFPANSQTLSQLHRTQTTKPTTNVYGKNMWDDDEYVDTGGNSIPKTTTGGAAARRINQQRKFQAQTVKLPDNPFMDCDYADMTGHQRNEHGMEKLRSTHQYKSMKVRSQSTSRDETETDGITRQASDADLVSSDRNLSISSSRSGSGTLQFTRSDTSPAFRSQDSIKENSAEAQRNDSVIRVRPVIEDVANAKESSNAISPPLINGDVSGHTNTMLPERQSSFAKSTLGGRIHNSSQHAPSPAHSTISTETTFSFLKPPVPGSPAVVYKNSNIDNNPDKSQAAIVVDITKPTSPMYGSFANSIQKSNDKSTLKFDASPPRHRAKNVALISLTILLMVALAATVIALVIIIVQQNDKISQLQIEIASLQIIAAPVASTTAHRDGMTSKHVTPDSLTSASVQTTNAYPSDVTTVAESPASTAVAIATTPASTTVAIATTPASTAVAAATTPASTAVAVATPSDDPSTTSSRPTTASPGTTSAVSMTTSTNAQPSVVTTVAESQASTAATPSDDPSTTSSRPTTASPGTTSTVSMTTLLETNYTAEIGTTGPGNDTTTKTT